VAVVVADVAVGAAAEKAVVAAAVAYPFFEVACHHFLHHHTFQENLV
jgi:hypothetical protein